MFAANNGVQYGQVINRNIGPNGPVNKLSTGWLEWKLIRDEWVQVPIEKFSQTAGQLFPDPCFGDFGLLSALAGVWSEATYEWWIVLQMKPESDLNLNIYDCVLKVGQFSPWGGAEQTGRYRSGSQSVFVLSANPSIKVKAYPGEYATPGFTAPFVLDSRVSPSLDGVALADVLYTSKALWSENLVLEMPETGKMNRSGQTMYNLKQGDLIYVKVTIPYNNTCDIRYGADSVIVKYIGICGTWHYGNPCP